ncbi:MAG TPA: protein kinase, partial [Thermoanaerobaculia bacterium]
MTPAEWRRVKEVLAGALSLPRAERAGFVSAALEGDVALRRRAEDLLADSDSAGSFLEADAREGAIADLADTEHRYEPALSAGGRLGRYEILSTLGRGGMGEVYRARDRQLRRDVAVKVLTAEVAEDPERLARFEREASAVSALSDPHIVAVYDVGKEGRTPYIVSELIEGETLRDALASGPLPIPRAL